MVDEEDEQICVITNDHSICCGCRFHCFLYYEEISISWGMVCLTVTDSVCR